MSANAACKIEKMPNGAVVCWEPYPVCKYAVLDCRGHEHGFRRRLEDARALAASLPGEPYVPPEPAPIHRSPRALKQPAAPAYVDPGPQPDESPAVALGYAPRVLVQYARAKSLPGILVKR